jgi:hypothetical protein
MLSCVGSGLAAGWSPVLLPTILGLRNLSESKLFKDALWSKLGATGSERGRREEILHKKRIGITKGLDCTI